jgi:hypothetical protein
MTFRDHSTIEELLSVQVLGGLDADDREVLYREMAAHGPDCPECRRLRNELGDVAGRLSFALEPVPIRRELEEETLALARMQGDTVPLRRVRGGRAGLWLARRRAHKPRLLLSRLVAAGLALATFVAGWTVRDLTAGPSFDFATATVVSFQAQPGKPGNLAVAYHPGKAGAYVFGSGLQAPPERTYELWTFQNGTPIRATCLQPRSDGTVIAYLDTNLSASQQMAVTVESPSCPSAPTTQPILTADLTSV